MAAKAKPANPKAKNKAKPKAKAGPETNASDGVDGQAVASSDNVVKQATSPPRSSHPDLSIRSTSELLRMIAAPVRLKALMYLSRSPGVSVGDLVRVCGQSQPAVSHHLALLRHSGLVYADRDGKLNRYHLTGKGRAAATLLVGITEQEA